jgi:hypothetical protein
MVLPEGAALADLIAPRAMVEVKRGLLKGQNR